MIRINCEEGVWFKFIGFEFLTVARIVSRVYEKDSVIARIMSACDRIHMANSLHHEGLAWDWRIWGLKDPKAIADEIRREAQAVDFHYDVIFGDEKHLDHMHTEYDIRKKRPNA